MHRRSGWLMVGALASLVAAAAAAAACGSFGSDAATGDGQEGGGGGGGQEGGPIDATTGSDASDASADAGNCVVLLAEDFTADLNASNWTPEAPAPSVVILDQALGNPAAPSLFATGQVTTANAANARLAQTVFFDGGVGTVTLDFNVTIEGPDGGTAYAELGCEAVFRNANKAQTIAALTRYSSGDLGALVEDKFTGAKGLADSFVQHQPAGWHHVRITTTEDAPASALVTYEVDGKRQTTNPQLAFRTALPSGTDRVEVVCGLVYADMAADSLPPSSLVSVHVDDVVLSRCAP